MMQALWSRSAQTRFCQCGPCLHALRAVSRRTTSNINRRRIKAGDVFAGSFTAMFATAAVMDMRKKEERTREWDRAIEEVKNGKDWESIRTPDSISIGKQAEPGRNIMGNQVHEYTPDANIVKTMKGLSVGKLVGSVPMPMAEAHEKSAQGRKGIHAVRDELDRILADITKMSGNTAVVAQEGAETEVAPVEGADNSIFAERGPDGMQETNFREMKMDTWQPTSPLYANQVGELVSKLVYDLLSAVSAGAKDKIVPEVDHVDSTPAAIHQRRRRKAELKAMAIYQEIAKLSERGSFPSYIIPKPEQAAMERKALNDSINHLMSDGLNKRNSSRSLDQMVAGICYNLLASTVSPDITTFNIMIERFTRYKQHDLASYVISFLGSSPFKSNERTISAILNHYRAKNYEIGFRRTINRIRGFEAGLGLTEIKSGKIVRSKFAAIWADKNDFAFKKGVLRETAKINGQLYETLIRGCLQFGQLGQALGYVRSAIQQGNVVRKKLFHELVKYCSNSDRPQYYLTLLLGAMVRQFAEGLEKVRGIQYDFYVRETVHQILQALGLEPSVESLRKLQQSTCMPCDIHPPNFEAMLEHLQHEEIKDDFISLYREAALVEKKIQNVKVAINGHRRIRRLIEDLPSTKKLDDRCEAHVKAQFFLGNEDWVRNLGLPRRSADDYLRIINHIDAAELFELTESRLNDLGISSPGVRSRLLERIQLLQGDILPPLQIMDKKDRLAAIQKLNTYQKAIKTVQRNTVKNVYREFPQDVRLRYTNMMKTQNIPQRDALMVLLETRRILSLEGRLIDPKEEQPAIDAAKIIEGQKAMEPATTEDMITAILGGKKPEPEKVEEKEYKIPQFKEPGYFDPTPEIRWAPLELTPNGYVRRPIPNADIRVQM